MAAYLLLMLALLVILKLALFWIMTACKKADADNATDWRGQYVQMQQLMSFWGVGAMAIMAAGAYLWRGALYIGAVVLAIILLIEVFGFRHVAKVASSALCDIDLNAETQDEREGYMILKRTTSMLLSMRLVSDTFCVIALLLFLLQIM